MSTLWGSVDSKGISKFILPRLAPLSLNPARVKAVPNPWPKAPHLVQLTDFVLAFNVFLIICKDFKPRGERRDQSSVRSKAKSLAQAQQTAGASPPTQALFIHPRASMQPSQLAHRSWCMSMLTMSLNRSGCLGEKKPLLNCSMICRSSGIRS